MQGKVRPSDLAKVERQQVRAELLKTLDCIRKRQDFSLFVDLLTETEQLMLARRIRIAKHLIAGETIDDIRLGCRTGQATVVAVHRWLRSRFSDYRDVLPGLYESMRDDRTMEKQSKPLIPNTFRWIRAKYPLHYLILNILLNDVDWRRDTTPQPRPYRPQRQRRYQNILL